MLPIITLDWWNILPLNHKHLDTKTHNDVFRSVRNKLGRRENASTLSLFTVCRSALRADRAEKVTAMLTTQTDGERLNVKVLSSAQTLLVRKQTSDSFFRSDVVLISYWRRSSHVSRNIKYHCYIETLDSVNIAGKHSQKSPSSVLSVCVVWHRLTF